MRILHVNKFLYRRGGAEAYMFDVSAVQRDAGHEIAFFGMEHPDNEPFPFASFFPKEIEFDPAPRTATGKIKAVGRMMYSTSARKGMERVVRAFRPDIVHLHNIYHQLSPSILRPLKDNRIPTVMTLHDYKLACPTYQFLDHGRLCEACLGGHFGQAAVRRCNDGSLLKSAVNAVELAVHSRLQAYGWVHVFVCPSRFLLTKMATAGVFPDRLRHVPNFIDSSVIETKTRPGEGVVYAGRLSEEKGVDVLVAAGAHVRAPIDIAGDGPRRAELERLASQVGASRIRFHGRLPKASLYELIRGAAVTALPSRWYENQPLSVLDSFACGVPVVGSELGGIPELIRPRVDGYLVPPNDPVALASALQSVVEDAVTALAMGRAGRRKVEAMFSPQAHLRQLDGVYREASLLANVKSPAQ